MPTRCASARPGHKRTLVRRAIAPFRRRHTSPPRRSPASAAPDHPGRRQRRGCAGTARLSRDAIASVIAITRREARRRGSPRRGRTRRTGARTRTRMRVRCSGRMPRCRSRVLGIDERISRESSATGGPRPGRGAGGLRPRARSQRRATRATLRSSGRRRGPTALPRFPGFHGRRRPVGAIAVAVGAQEDHLQTIPCIAVLPRGEGGRAMSRGIPVSLGSACRVRALR
jgi:hypothetical protein